MLEMGAKHGHQALLRMDPKVKISVPLASGFTQNGEIEDALDSGRGFIGKLFQAPQVVEKIWKITDNP